MGLDVEGEDVHERLKIYDIVRYMKKLHRLQEEQQKSLTL